eukprot:gene12723-21947_t
MNHADIVVARWNDTAQGDCVVEDQFNDGDFEGKPARDVDRDCRSSMNGLGTTAPADIGGRDDFVDVSCARADGWARSGWSRKLSTGDARDWNITTGWNHVIIAHGQGPEYAYHGFGTTGTCVLDFYAGALKQPCKVFWT